MATFLKEESETIEKIPRSVLSRSKLGDIRMREKEEVSCEGTLAVQKEKYTTRRHPKIDAADWKGRQRAFDLELKKTVQNFGRAAKKNMDQCAPSLNKA